MVFDNSHKAVDTRDEKSPTPEIGHFAAIFDAARIVIPSLGAEAMDCWNNMVAAQRKETVIALATAQGAVVNRFGDTEHVDAMYGDIKQA